jgi:lipopolysaccharide export system permease protein
MIYGESPSPQRPAMPRNLLGLSLLDRYVLRELWPPFLFGVGVFTAIGLSVGALFELVDQITDSGIPLGIAVQIFLLQIPYYVSIAFPMAMLLTSLLAYSRLSNNSEIIALRGCGISLYRLVLPAVILSLVVAGGTFGINQILVPASKYQAAALLSQALSQEQPQFHNRNIFYQEFGEDKELKRLFYARRFDGLRMNGLTILDFTQKPLSQVVTAETAQYNPSQSIWSFFNGTIYLVAPDGSSRNILRFEEHQLQLPRTPLDLVAIEPSTLEMNIPQLSQRLQQARQQGDSKDIQKLRMRIQQKYSLPFIAVVFGIIGASLGLRPRRTSTSTGFGISVLIIFAYYLLSFLTDALGQIGTLGPLTAAWVPTLLGLFIGLSLLIWTAR